MEMLDTQAGTTDPNSRVVVVDEEIDMFSLYGREIPPIVSIQKAMGPNLQGNCHLLLVGNSPNVPNGRQETQTLSLNFGERRLAEYV